MRNFLTELSERFQENRDFFKEPFMLGNNKVYLIGLNSIVDLLKTKEAIVEFGENSVLEFTKTKDYEAAATKAALEILEGKLIICSADNKGFTSFKAVRKQLVRSVSNPVTENTVMGSQDAFIEDMRTNLGIIREKLVAGDLVIRGFTFGKTQVKRVSVLYRKETADPKLVGKIIASLEKSKDKDINFVQDLNKVLDVGKFNLLSHYHIVEMPTETVSSLNNGRVALFMEGFPFAVIIPHLFIDMFAHINDLNHSFITMNVVRLIRIAGALTTLTLPGLYVALVSVNPEALKIELALSIAKSRIGVPYPAFVEIFIMLLILELIQEAIIRLPKTIGPTITMVGGIIIGQAIVQARLVSNILIIIISATVIANSTVTGAQNMYTLRVLKYVVMLIAAVYGILGIMMALVFICGYLSSKSTFGIPYVSGIKGGAKNG
ncbi:spore gernimation protein GerA [Neobacillus piezotolerans]|uniref:Spore gernimation protein GerA n=1 Tax=Neobacillus piezotolerans TaxID=2259171 RepID=A0A3D8GRE8_9BACI|nr:spore germination protein [Neobacillus piezotolerans]RDU37060.1 spore gernimation protein GerA [Neobacillus piezotolerans]